jgi:hypothetical protein
VYIPDNIIQDYEKDIDMLLDKLEIRYQSPFTLEQAYESNELGLENVVGFGIGEKLVGGMGQGALAFQAHVVRKVRPDLVKKGYSVRELVSDVVGKDALSDVLEVGRPYLFHHRRHRYSPQVPGGAAVGNNQGRWGTLGAWVTDGLDSFILSCWHSIDGGSGAGSPVFHPPGGNQIATITVGIDPATCPTHAVTIDAAMAQADNGTEAGHFVLQIGEIRGDRKVNSTRFEVCKSGAETHLTKGWVINVSASDHLADPQTNRTIFYEKQLLIQPNLRFGSFAAAGDSGALVLSTSNYAIGLLVGGSFLPGYLAHVYFATPIQQVMRSLENSTNIAKLDFFKYA